MLLDCFSESRIKDRQTTDAASQRICRVLGKPHRCGGWLKSSIRNIRAIQRNKAREVATNTYHPSVAEKHRDTALHRICFSYCRPLKDAARNMSLLRVSVSQTYTESDCNTSAEDDLTLLALHYRF